MQRPEIAAMRFSGESSMVFSGPVSADFRNVNALNHAFLALLRSSPAARRSIDELSPPLCERITSLDARQLNVLATAPFMLMSLRERDDQLWDQVFSSTSELLIEAPDNDLQRLQAAALGFVWQLARQNPYTLRLICGASLHWSERLAERTLFDLFAAIAPYPDLLVLRRADDHDLWQKLLIDGVRPDPRLHRAVHVSALQTVLTRTTANLPRRWAVAACKTEQPELRVSDE